MIHNPNRNQAQSDANFARYTKIVNWAQKRYTVKGKLFLLDKLKPSRYSLIEDLAANKLLGTNRFYAKL